MLKRAYCLFMSCIISAMCILGSYSNAYASASLYHWESEEHIEYDIPELPEHIGGDGVTVDAVITLSTATLCILASLLALCGVYLAWDDLKAFGSGFVAWVETTYAHSEDMMKELGFFMLGATTTYIYLYQALREYLKIWNKTYDMNPADYKYFANSKTISLDQRLNYTFKFYFFSCEDIDGKYWDMGTTNFRNYADGYCFVFDSDGRLAVGSYSSSGQANPSKNFMKYYSSLPLAGEYLYWDLPSVKALADVVTVPVFQSWDDAEQYLLDGCPSDVVGFQAAQYGIKWLEAMETLVDSVTILAVPKSPEEIAAIDSALSGAITMQDVLDALADIAVTDTSTLPPVTELPDYDDILSTLLALLALVQALPQENSGTVVSKLVASSIGVNIRNMSKTLDDIAQFDFADWSIALGMAMLESQLTFADIIGIDVAMNAIDAMADDTATIAGWDISAINDTLAAVDATFADWSRVYSLALDNVLADTRTITGTLADIKERVVSIPDALADIKDIVISIPASIAASIADFFTIDTVAVDVAKADLQLTFDSRFSGLQKLGEVFSFGNRSFDDTPPVFTMPVPDALKFAYPDTDVIVIMDLREHSAIYASIRILIQAMIWFLFAKWLLRQFDVNFHVG